MARASWTKPDGWAAAHKEASTVPYRAPAVTGGRLPAVVTTLQDGTADADVVHVRLEGYGTVALPVGPEAELLRPPEAAMA
jgi:hypothetical protein